MGEEREPTQAERVEEEYVVTQLEPDVEPMEVDDLNDKLRSVCRDYDQESEYCSQNEIVEA